MDGEAFHKIDVDCQVLRICYSDYTNIVKDAQLLQTASSRGSSILTHTFIHCDYVFTSKNLFSQNGQ